MVTISFDTTEKCLMYLRDGILEMEEQNLCNPSPLSQRIGYSIRAVRQLVEQGELVKAAFILEHVVVGFAERHKDDLGDPDRVFKMLHNSACNIALCHMEEAFESDREALEDFMGDVDDQAIEQAKATREMVH